MELILFAIIIFLMLVICFITIVSYRLTDKLTNKIMAKDYSELAHPEVEVKKAEINKNKPIVKEYLV
jgi:hypothetical protein